MPGKFNIQEFLETQGVKVESVNDDGTVNVIKPDSGETGTFNPKEYLKPNSQQPTTNTHHPIPITNYPSLITHYPKPHRHESQKHRNRIG